MKIYHNPRCRKSRETLALLVQNGTEPEIIEYLKTALERTEIQELLMMLKMTAEQLVRKEEKIYKELYKEQELTESQFVDILCQHPILIQRPIVVKDNVAVLGRPPGNVLDLF